MGAGAVDNHPIYRQDSKIIHTWTEKGKNLLKANPDNFLRILTASPLAAAFTNSSVTSPDTCGSNNFFNIADNRSPFAATDTFPSDDDA